MIQENYVKFIEEKIKLFWDMPSMTNIEDKKTYSYKEIANKILWFHNIFKKIGINQGDKIGIVGKNSINWGVSYLAITTYGATVVPILPNFSNDNLIHIINHSECKIVLIGKLKIDDIDEDVIPNVLATIHLDSLTIRGLKRKLKQKDKIDQAFSKEYNIGKADFELSDMITNDLVGEIIYTSGTTGFTKGVMLPYNSIMANINLCLDYIPKLTTGKKMLVFLPIAHVFACACDFLFPFTKGVHIHFMGKLPAPRLLINNLHEVSPEIIMSVPLVLEKMVKKNIFPMLEKKFVKFITHVPVLKQVFYKKIKDKLLEVFGGSLKELVIGGAPLNHEVEKFLMDIKFPFTIGYGMSECGPLISYSNSETHRYRSAGKVINYIEVKVDSKDPEKIPGDLLVKGEQVMYGYYKNEEATSAVLSSDGWLNTGDLAIIDRDNFIYLKGRSKNLILGPNGENIFPQAIEQTFNNLPYVQESLVIERAGKLVILVYPDIDLADKAGINSSLYEKIMQQNVKKFNEKAAVFERISELKVMSEPFQKTPTQKIKRYLYK